ncbi:hypothetical protein OEZ60_04710 [Defluviimonas sp. WL0024]|uniref:DUF6647 domain-containing protein n=1 Tax=Albidovulum salinarum TaxID=2984153 RepID=A0ABT2X041_9RHOB|nr:DUF6647 family protein [Defluviimonas sp. WL0024]MCU9847301.1 hypothetical protein [Defluviimonas sp. WL0024]
MRFPYLATLGAAAVLAVAALPAQGETTISGAKTHAELAAIEDAVPVLEAWIDHFGTYPRVETVRPRIVLVPAGKMAAISAETAHHGPATRGAYDAETATIYLQRPWFADRVYDRSILLHELVHHRQTHARHWYCDQAMEWDAYKLQETFLDQAGIEAGIFWLAIALESSCAVRDHHPD